MDLTARLDAMEAAIKKPSFRQSSGKANEVNYWIFDYPPEKELEVRERIEYMKNKNLKGTDEYQLVVFDLYDIIEIFRIQQDILPVDAALAALRTMEPELFIRADQHFLQVFSDVFQSVIHFDIPPIFKNTAARRLPYILCKLRAGATFCLS